MHFKNRHQTHTDLLIFRVLSIILLVGYSIIDTVMYSSYSMKSDILTFLHGSRYVALEILVIVYASGVAAFGISIEIYIFIPKVIINCVLAACNCGGPAEKFTTAVWIVKIVFVFVTVEACYHNFRKWKNYDNNFHQSACAMLRQALLFSGTMLFLSSSGLRAVYNGTSKNLPKLCPYDTQRCGIINIYAPLFSYDNEACLGDLIAYISGREQIRFLRDLILLNGISYAVFNANFLDVEHGARYKPLRILLVIIFAAIASSVLVSSIDPYVFIHRCQLAYNIIECILFAILFGLPMFNLYSLRNQHQLNEEIQISPRVLPEL